MLGRPSTPHVPKVPYILPNQCCQLGTRCSNTWSCQGGGDFHTQTITNLNSKVNWVLSTYQVLTVMSTLHVYRFNSKVGPSREFSRWGICHPLITRVRSEGPVWQRERAVSCSLSSDLHTLATAHVPTHIHPQAILFIITSSGKFYWSRLKWEASWRRGDTGKEPPLGLA